MSAVELVVKLAVRVSRCPAVRLDLDFRYGLRYLRPGACARAPGPGQSHMPRQSQGHTKEIPARCQPSEPLRRLRCGVSRAKAQPWGVMVCGVHFGSSAQRAHRPDSQVAAARWPGRGCTAAVGHAASVEDLALGWVDDMARTVFLDSRSRAFWPFRLLVVFCLLLIPLLVPSQNAHAATASDDFNRANGGLGASWTNISDGGLAIASQVVAGTASSAVSGDIRTA